MNTQQEIYVKPDNLNWREVSGVLAENDELRRQVSDLEQRRESQQQEISRLQAQVSALRQLYDRDQEVYDVLERQLLDIEGESQRISDQTMEFGRQNTYLASLYAASSCLHESSDRVEVLETVRDVVLNLIGSREVAVFELEDGEDGSDAKLSLTYAAGLEAGSRDSIALGEGLIGGVAESGESYLAGISEAGAALSSEVDLSAAIPLRFDNQVTGVIAVFKLLPQKTGGFDALDQELFDLLAHHAGASLYRTSLRAERGAGSYIH